MQPCLLHSWTHLWKCATRRTFKLLMQNQLSPHQSCLCRIDFALSPLCPIPNLSAMQWCCESLHAQLCFCVSWPFSTCMVHYADDCHEAIPCVCSGQISLGGVKGLHVMHSAFNRMSYNTIASDHMIKHKADCRSLACHQFVSYSYSKQRHMGNHSMVHPLSERLSCPD